MLPHAAPDAWKWMQSHPDNLISQSLFMRPGDVPKADAHTLFGSQMPSWMRTMSDVFMGSNGFGNTYTNAFGTRGLILPTATPLFLRLKRRSRPPR